MVHLYGHPVDMDPILDIARRHNLFVLEDAAEAHGAEYKEKNAGSLGDIATFSFFGNKIITTGEGGMIITNDDVLASRIRQLKGQGMDPDHRYWFPIIGYNYRMTNIAAAIGLAQLENVEWHLQRRREITTWYQEILRGNPRLSWQPEKTWAKHSYWMFTIILSGEIALCRDDFMVRLARKELKHVLFSTPCTSYLHTAKC